MKIDPVILLAEELRTAEAALAKATQLYNRGGRREHGELVELLLARIRRLFGEFLETAPTSALGAAELVRMAAGLLPLSHARYGAMLRQIAGRLAAGRREHTDLVWLRALEAGLIDSQGEEGGGSGQAAHLLGLAIAGAARPVMVFRAVETGGGKGNWKAILAAGGRSQEA